MANEIMTSDFFRVFERVKIPLLITDSDLRLTYANQSAREILPVMLQIGRRIELDDFLQHEDSLAFETMITECVAHDESVGTFKQKGADKYYKVNAYYLNNKDGEVVFQFEDVSQSRILENQMYEHLLDLYNQLETQEREITDLRARALRTE